MSGVVAEGRACVMVIEAVDVLLSVNISVSDAERLRDARRVCVDRLRAIVMKPSTSDLDEIMDAWRKLKE